MLLDDADRLISASSSTSFCAVLCYKPERLAAPVGPVCDLTLRKDAASSRPHQHGGPRRADTTTPKRRGRLAGRVVKTETFSNHARGICDITAGGR